MLRLFILFIVNFLLFLSGSLGLVWYLMKIIMVIIIMVKVMGRIRIRIIWRILGFVRLRKIDVIINWFM